MVLGALALVLALKFLPCGTIRILIGVESDRTKNFSAKVLRGGRRTLSTSQDIPIAANPYSHGKSGYQAIPTTSGGAKAEDPTSSDGVCEAPNRVSVVTAAVGGSSGGEGAGGLITAPDSAHRGAQDGVASPVSVSSSTSTISWLDSSSTLRRWGYAAGAGPTSHTSTIMAPNARKSITAENINNCDNTEYNKV